MINEVRLYSNVPREQEGDEHIGKGVLLAQHSDHFLQFDTHQRGAGQGGRGHHAHTLRCSDARLSHKVS